MSTLNEPPCVYGKLPARGDFITRGFERAFLEPWDEWLRQAILASQESLAELWLDTYLTSPVWRFALNAGACGPDTMLGVLIPSVDKVGRYFPLTLGHPLASGLELTGLIAQAAPWYRATEALALAALDPGFSLDAFAQPIVLDVAGAGMALPSDEALASPGLYLPFGGDAQSAALRHAHHPLAQGLSLWWTTGSARVAPCLLICPGMPPTSSFTALLDGDWGRHGWAVPVQEQLAVEAPAAQAAADPAAGEEARDAAGAAEPSKDAAPTEMTQRLDGDALRNVIGPGPAGPHHGSEEAV